MPENVAARYLAALSEHGIESLFVNAGTDFAPIVEAYARNKEVGGATLPTPIVCAHENLAAGMAHGAYLASGRPQALMLHVSVGTANAVCGVTNAARDRVPMLVTAGRSPILEDGALGARDMSIHWAQELFDQGGMLREVVKWDYELRDARQVDAVVDRALSLATSHPRGPVYLSLPREVLAGPAPDTAAGHRRTPVPATVQPDPAAITELADRLVAAEHPAIVVTGSGAEPASVALLEELCTRFAIGVADHASRYLNVRFDHPHHLGNQVGAVLERSDVLLFIECDVPWIQSRTAPGADAFVAQAGVDPLFSRYPMRTHRADLNISATPAALLTALTTAMAERADGIDPGRSERMLAAGRETAAAASGCSPAPRPTSTRRSRRRRSRQPSGRRCALRTSCSTSTSPCPTCCGAPNRARTSSCPRPGGSAGGCPPRSAPSTRRPTARSWPRSVTAPTCSPTRPRATMPRPSTICPC